MSSCYFVMTICINCVLSCLKAEVLVRNEPNFWMSFVLHRRWRISFKTVSGDVEWSFKMDIDVLDCFEEKFYFIAEQHDYYTNLQYKLWKDEK